MQSFRTEIENPIVQKDIIELERKIALFKDEKVDEERFRSLRLARGVYGQRQPGVQKTIDLAEAGKIKMLLDSEVYKINGNGRLKEITVKQKDGEDIAIETPNWLPLFGLTSKLGPIANWGLDIEKNAIKVNNAVDYATNIDGVYAIGDVNTYPGKLKLILCGFHEATIMVQSAFKRLYPDKRNVLKYTTVNGITGFDS